MTSPLEKGSACSAKLVLITSMHLHQMKQTNPFSLTRQAGLPTALLQQSTHLGLVGSTAGLHHVEVSI